MANVCNVLQSQDISLGDDISQLRKLGFKSKEDFKVEQKKICDAMIRLATDEHMERAWDWLILNESHITSVHHVKRITENLFLNWRLTAKKNGAERKATYKKIASLAKNLSSELRTIEFEENTPLNEINVLLMNHPWFKDENKTRENAHAGKHIHSMRTSSLIETVKNLPVLSAILDQISIASLQALELEKKPKQYAVRKMNTDSAFRTFTINYLKIEMNKVWDNCPTFVLVALTRAISNDQMLDDSHALKLINKQ